ncbi:MAG: L-threonylcarbamoyladenylate synthase [Candidatus Endobugula sp.]|jgi:L-threonylcarbamoyladenylate synthase
MLFQKYNPSIRIAARIMRQGGVIAYPTEAVWGLGCSPSNKSAVHRILSLKRRHVSKGVILVASSIEQFAPYLHHITPEQRAILSASWPGPFTWLVPHHHLVPSWVSGDHESVALRVSEHPHVRYLCDAFGGPIVSTSANTQGKPAATQAWQVKRYFNQRSELDWIVRGCVGKRTAPSTITDLVTGEVVR